MVQTEVASSILFSRDAGNYDDLRRRLIPCFDEFYGSALKLIEEWRPREKIAVLDIGAGTGLFSAMVHHQRPGARFRLLDGSAVMLERARSRFRTNDPVDYHVADMVDGDLEGPWDLVISALAIHHLDDDGKRALYRRIRAALKPGGLFVNAEQVLGPNPAAEQRYARLWLEQIRALGVPEDEIEKAQERMSHDKCAPLGSQLRWLEEAGFTDVDCSFKAWRFAVFSGRA